MVPAEETQLAAGDKVVWCSSFAPAVGYYQPVAFGVPFSAVIHADETVFEFRARLGMWHVLCKSAFS